MKIIITESQSESLKNNLMKIIKRSGFNSAAKAVGSQERLIDFLFGGDVSQIGDVIEPPYFRTLKSLGLGYRKELMTKILSKVFNQNISVGPFDAVYNEKNKVIYSEDPDGYWAMIKYDDEGKKIYTKDSNGEERRYVYDKHGTLRDVVPV